MHHGQDNGVVCFHMDQPANRVVYDFGACDEYWPSYGAGAHIASCGGDARVRVGNIGISCLCMLYESSRVEFNIGAC